MRQMGVMLAALLILGCSDDGAEKSDGPSLDTSVDLGQLELGADLARDTGPVADQAADHAPRDLPPSDSVKLDACTAPSYSQDCSQVPSFQCGFSASCNGSVVTADWHEHVFCDDGPEQIVSYTCSYTCPNGCLGGYDWPQDGQDLVQKYCQP